MAAGCDEVILLHFLLEDLGIPLTGRFLLFCNNQARLHIAANPVFHECTQHIEIDCHFTHDKNLCGTIVTTHVGTIQHLVDLFTKPLGKKKF